MYYYPSSPSGPWQSYNYYYYPRALSVNPNFYPHSSSYPSSFENMRQRYNKYLREGRAGSYTIRLDTIRAVEEINEASASEEPYVLVTAVDLRRSIAGISPPNLEVFRYGIWEDTDAGEVKVNTGPPFWGLNSSPQEISSINDVAFIVSLMENDNAQPDQYKSFVKTVATTSLTSSLGEPNNSVRVTRLVQDIRDALNGVNLPIPFALDDDHIGTVELKLDSSDLIAAGVKSKSLTIRSSEGHYVLTFQIKAEAITSPLTVSRRSPSSANNKSIAAVSRIPSSMEVWWIGANGSVQDAFWYEGQNWQRFELAPAGSASQTGRVTAVSRIPGSMEVWWIGANGSVQGAFWYEGQQWSRYELAPAGSASPNGGITAVSRIPGSMEVWWIGANGSVQDAFWYEGQNWQRFELAPAGSASPNGGITAVSRIPGSMEVWWVGANGSVQDAFWYEGQNWQRFELAPAGSASPNGGITAVSRIPGSMEVWWVGANGSVQDAFWYEGQNWQRFELAPAGSASTS